MKSFALSIALCTVFAAGLAAQPSTISNAQVQTRAVEGALDGMVKRLVSETTDARWIAYEAPIVPGDRFMCDWNERTHNAPASTSVKLEGPSVLRVFYRVENRAVTRIRMFSEGCSIDAGGRPVLWLTGVRPAESVAVLRAFADGGTERRVADGAIAAIAMHADPSAIDATIALARSGGTTYVRGQALFWLAQRAGDRAIGTIREALDRDPDTEVKKKAVFALSQLPKDEGVPRLIDVARTHSNAAVRKQAMFWLGQSKDPRALAFFESILTR